MSCSFTRKAGQASSLWALLSLFAACKNSPETEQSIQKYVPQCVYGIAFYTADGGITFSTDGNPFRRYPQVVDQELVRQIPMDLAEQLIEDLRSAGFLDEPNRVAPFYPITPMWICIADGNLRKECGFFAVRGCEIPEKYLRPIRDRLKPYPHQRFSDFLTLNESTAHLEPDVDAEYFVKIAESRQQSNDWRDVLALLAQIEQLGLPIDPNLRMRIIALQRFLEVRK